MDSEIDSAAKILWEYNKLDQKLGPADCILVMGSHDKRVAGRGAELFKQGLAPIMIVSGGRAPNTPSDWKGTEAEVFAEIIRRAGVPNDKIIIENQASNTAENFSLSFEVLKSHNLNPQKLILVTKPYMERRALATFQKMYPDKIAQVTSPQFDYEDYPDEEVSKELFINTMVGDTQRVLLYPQRGFSVPQTMPDEVKDAMNKLIELGFNKQIIK